MKVTKEHGCTFVPQTESTWIVVLNWNGKADTLRCLASLKQAGGPKPTLLVVDNDSSDDSVPEIRRLFPDVHLLAAGSNLGYTGGNNLGITHAIEHGAEVVVVLNNDVVVREGFLPPLMRALQAPGRRAVSPDIRFLDRPDVSWFAGGCFDKRIGRPTHCGVARSTHSADLAPTEYLTGCCLATTAEAWREVGLFDNRFFLTFEDSDWSERARSCGYELAVVLDSVIEHAVSRSFAGVSGLLGTYYFVRNNVLFLRLHRRLRLVWLIQLVREFVVRPVRDRRNNGTAAAAMAARGVLDGMLCRSGRASPRIHDQAKRTFKVVPS